MLIENGAGNLLENNVEKSAVGFVNETRGSYFFLETMDHQFTVQFYTSGLFDLYGIYKKSRVHFCDTGEGVFLIGLGQKEKVSISGNRLILGPGGPRKSFAVGKMPALLKKLHHFKDFPADRTSASTP